MSKKDGDDNGFSSVDEFMEGEFSPKPDEEVEEKEEESNEEEAEDDTVDEDDADADDSDGHDESDDEGEGEDADDGDQDADEAESDDQEKDGQSSDKDSSGEEQTEVEKQAATIAALTKLIESQAINQLGTQVPAKQTPDAKPDAGKEAGDPPPAQTLAEVIGDVDFDAMQDDPQKFVDMLARVVNFTKEQTAQDVSGNFENIASQKATQAVNNQKLISDFYRDNHELASFKQVVGLTTQQVGTENPNWDIKQVLAESASRVYGILGIKSKAPTKDSKKIVRKGRKPVIPKDAKGTRKAKKADTRNPMQKQIDNLIN